MPAAAPLRTIIRTAARSMVEPHPFSRNPVTTAPYPWRASDLGKKVVGAGALFVPLYGSILFWPIPAAFLCNGYM